MKISSKLLIVAIAGASVFSACKSKKKTGPTKVEGEVEVSIPCSGTAYMTDKKHFRANAVGESADMNIARKKASNNAKTALAGNIQTTIKATNDNYMNSREYNNVEEIEEKFEALSREVINQQLNNLNTLCEKTMKDKSTGNYKVYMALEMPVDAVREAMQNKLSQDKSLKIDYDYEKYKETFDKEMEKMESAY